MSTCQLGVLPPVVPANDIFRAITRAIKNKARPNDFADYQSLEKIAHRLCDVTRRPLPPHIKNIV